ncbi:unnamed protein product, partial [Vitis vinifera]
MAEAAVAQAKPGCPDRCGNVSIPYPFGTKKDCNHSQHFLLHCNDSVMPPKLTLGMNLHVVSISLGELKILNFLGRDCYNSYGGLVYENDPWLRLGSGYTISGKRNKFIAVGCDTYAIVRAYKGEERYTTGCMSVCDSITNVKSGSCSGIGCCETSIPEGTTNFTVKLSSYNNHRSVWAFNPCSYAFVVEETHFKFSSNQFRDLNNTENLPVVLDWRIGKERCKAARKTETYACKGKSECYEPDDWSGYLCKCLDGYHGNPYLPDGCQDINECDDPSLNKCVKKGRCKNTPGNYTCSCPKGYHGDGRQDGDRCNLDHLQVIPVVLDDNLFQVLDKHIVNEGNIEQLREAANLAKRCLRLKGDERPTMKEVSMELERIKMMEKQAWIDSKEKEQLHGESSQAYDNDCSFGFTSASFNSLRFFAVGCDTYALLQGYQGGDLYTTGCMSICSSEKQVQDGSCSGAGCCQVSFPEGLDDTTLTLSSYFNHTKVHDFNPCSYAFIAEESAFNFSSKNLTNLQDMEKLPRVVDWSIGNETCQVAKTNPSSYACKENSTCSEPSGRSGYLCKCFDGYHGNPYLDGCQDIDECENSSLNKCVEKARCKNIPGNYTCSCRKGYHGDGREDGDGCNPNMLQVIQIALGVSIGLISLLMGSSWLYWGLKKRKFIKLKKKFFEQNGGLMLRQQLSSQEGSNETVKIFSAEELEKATDKYAENKIIGQGGYGTVYKGTLTNGRIVAIKKSKMVDKILDERIVNEENIEQLKETANLAKKCLKLKGDERPTMKEVAMKLERMRMVEMHPWTDPEENEYLLGESSHTVDNGCSIGSTNTAYDSLKGHIMLPNKDKNESKGVFLSIPISFKGLLKYNVTVHTYHNHTFTWSFNPCSYTFLVEEGSFNFSTADLIDLQKIDKVSTVLDWAVGNQTCEEAQKNSTSYACKENSNYVDECEDPKLNDCTDRCTNTIGGYNCSCPWGHHGHGRGKDGCTADQLLFIKITIGVGVGLIVLLTSSSWLYWILKKRKFLKVKEKYFRQNGGLILEQQLSKREGSNERSKIFTAEELEKATNKYNESKIIGRGGFGIDNISHEVNGEELNEVALLAKRCLELKGEDRPTMKEVAMELEGMRKMKMHPWIGELNSEETIHLLDESSNTHQYDTNGNVTTVYDSIRDHITLPLHNAR